MKFGLDGFPIEFSGEARLFPLPNLVLYPGCVQPLHIFESRYCEMLENAMADDQLIAIATLLPGYEAEYYSRPPISSHVCIGRVVMNEKTPDDTYNLVVIGSRRAVVLNEITPVKSYRRAAVEIIEDVAIADGTVADGTVADGTVNDAEMDQKAEQARHLGMILADRFIEKAKSAEKMAINFREGKISLSVLTDVVAFHFPFELPLKLKLLEERDPVNRANLILQALDKPELDIVTPENEFPFRDGKNPDATFPPPFGNN